MANQLSLFVPGEQEPRSRTGVSDPALEARFERLRPLAARLPASLFMGTSSWSFSGWAGLVFPRGMPRRTLVRDGLREYVRHPLLGTVGIDRSYYAPIPEIDLRRYADQLPAGFPCCAKAPATVTAAALKDGARQRPNPDFLSAERFVLEMLEPFGRAFADHCGPFILQVPPVSARLAPDPAAFVERLDRFLSGLPAGFRYAIELRDRALFTGSYARVLARHGAAHVYNYWTAMPGPGDQAATLPPESQPFVVVRLLLRPGTTYEDQREVFAPFDRLVEADETMRRAVVDIVERAVTPSRPVYLLVNNKAEGSSPLTIEALAERLAARSQASVDT